MTVEEILQNLKNKIYHPIYLLQGEEPYYIDVISEYIEEHILTDSEKEFNQNVLYGRDVDAPTLINHARRYPMMANYQVLIIKEAQEIKDLEGILPYVQNPLSSTLLVLCYKYKKLDKRTTLAKAIAKAGILFDSKRIYDNKIPSWIESQVKQAGYAITPKATHMLGEFLGTDLSRISNELKKLYINIRKGSRIDDELVERNIGISKDFNVFELQNALGTKNSFKANQIISYFASNPKDNPIVKVIPILFSWFTKIMLYHHLRDKSKNNAAAALGVHPFFLKDYQTAASNYRPAEVEGIIGILREYDLKSKGVGNNSANDGELMKELIYKIIHPRF